MKLTERDERRFWSKVALPDAGGHMLWMAARTGGYGRIGVGRKTLYAHRVSYALAYGEVPEGLQIDHLCRVRHCLAPEHLEAVTQQENGLRGESGKWQQAKTHCPRGHPYSGDNLYVRPDGGRSCRQCVRTAGRKWHPKRKAKRADA